jgi:segregation and condensation protein B
MARLEAVLFLAREPLSTRKLAQITSLADGTEARTLIRVLNRYYQQQGTAFRIEEVAGGFQLFARPQFGSWLRRLYQSPVQTRLSSPALETLAVVAYRQPVLRADVEAIRGVQSGEILRQLMERDLVRIVGRSRELGRPFLYGTTKRFLRVFGLRHLDDLPRAAGLRLKPAAPPNSETTPGRSGELETRSNCQRQEESDVRITPVLEPPTEHMHDRSQRTWPPSAAPIPVAAKDEEDDDIDEEDDYEDEDDDVDDEEDLEEDDLEDEEWEEVDDEDEDEDLDDEEDWEDDEDDEDDWDDDEDDDWEEDDEPD